MNSNFSDFIRFFPIFRLFPTFRLLDSTTLVQRHRYSVTDLPTNGPTDWPVTGLGSGDAYVYKNGWFVLYGILLVELFLVLTFPDFNPSDIAARGRFKCVLWISVHAHVLSDILLQYTWEQIEIVTTWLVPLNVCFVEDIQHTVPYEYTGTYTGI